MEDPPEGLTFEEMELWLDRALWRSQLQRLKNDYESVYRDMRDNRLFCITRNPMERRSTLQLGRIWLNQLMPRLG